MSTLSSAITASASALSAERTRIEAAVSNMANAESTRGPDGQPYRRRDVLLAADHGSFDSAFGRANGVGVNAVGVKVAGVVEDRAPFRRRYEPSHPDADAQGFVQLPNVDPQNEMVDLIGATRAYQANLTAITLIRDLVQKSLELGR
jgi:flagellar basal-body rod protein FlgC